MLASHAKKLRSQFYLPVPKSTLLKILTCMFIEQELLWEGWAQLIPDGFLLDLVIFLLLNSKCVANV